MDVCNKPLSYYLVVNRKLSALLLRRISLNLQVIKCYTSSNQPSGNTLFLSI